MISTNDFRTGLTVEVEGALCMVVDFQHVKPGKGAAFVRAKLKNVRTGSIVERTFNAGEKLPRAHLERRPMQYLYKDGENYAFMDTENYEQVLLSKEQIGDGIKFMKDNMNLMILFYQEETFGVELPNSVELKVVETEPGVRGDTAQGATKTAVMETGALVQVPLFIEVGDLLLVDTRTGDYLKRA